MAINSRSKGKRGELELSKWLREHGHDARRSQQFCGAAGDSDIQSESLSHFHIECKRTERGNLYEWLDQASREAKRTKMPIVMHRKNNREWVAILSLENFLGLITASRAEPPAP